MALMPPASRLRRVGRHPRTRHGTRTTPEPTASGSVAPLVSSHACRIARNFASLGAAEAVCRVTSVVVTLYLARILKPEGFGRIDFAFQVVFWLVLLVRDGIEMIVTREIARHPRLIHPLVGRTLAFRGLIAGAFFLVLTAISQFAIEDAAERAVLAIYGLMLMTTAFGLDFVFRGQERMGLVAVSLVIRTAAYALGVWVCVASPQQLLLVPVCLVAGESLGIGLVWACYVRSHGWPRLRISERFIRVCLARGRAMFVVQFAQMVLGSVDLLIVGVMSQWADIGSYNAPHRMTTAILTFGILFQQAVFPALARSWRESPERGRQALDGLVRLLMLGLVPVAVGTALLARPIVGLLLPADYAAAAMILAGGIWRVPLLSLAFLYQTALVALGCEGRGVRALLWGAAVSVPLVVVLRWSVGLAAAPLASILVAAGLIFVGHRRLAAAGRETAWHLHAGIPLLASAVMVPVCLLLEPVHLIAAVIGGAATYCAVAIALGALKHDAWRRPEVGPVVSEV